MDSYCLDISHDTRNIASCELIQQTAPSNKLLTKVSNKLITKETNSDLKFKLLDDSNSNIPVSFSVNSKDLIFKDSNGNVLNHVTPTSGNPNYTAEVDLGIESNVLFATVSIFSRNNIYADCDLARYVTSDEKNIPLTNASAFTENEVTYHENSFIGTCVARLIVYKTAAAIRIYASGVEVVPDGFGVSGDSRFLYWGNPNAELPSGCSNCLKKDSAVRQPKMTINGKELLVGNYYSSTVLNNTKSTSLVFADSDHPIASYLKDAAIVDINGRSVLKLHLVEPSEFNKSITPHSVFKISINH